MSEMQTEESILPFLPVGQIAWRVHAFGSVGSTNDVARRLVQGGAPEGTVVVAETQTAGRGRGGTPWCSPSGGLWFSLVLRPHIPPERASGLSIVSALAVARAAGGMSGVDTRIKWPNDVLVEGRKLAGAMIVGAGDGTLIVGVGLNVNTPGSELPLLHHYEATSLLVETGRRFPRPELLGRMLGELESRYFAYRRPGYCGLIEEWRELSIVLGEHVSVRTAGGELAGTVFGLEDDGGIVLRLPNGAHEKILPYGDVTLMLGGGRRHSRTGSVPGGDRQDAEVKTGPAVAGQGET